MGYLMKGTIEDEREEGNENYPERGKNWQTKWR